MLSLVPGARAGGRRPTRRPGAATRARLARPRPHCPGSWSCSGFGRFVGRRRPRSWSTPRWCSFAVSVLLLSPAPVDAAPFFLVFLAATGKRARAHVGQRRHYRRIRRVAGDAGCRGPVQRRLRLGAGDHLRLGRGGGHGQTGAAHRRVARHAGTTRRPGGCRRTAAHRREIHDVIAHSLAVTMLHLTGPRMALHPIRRMPKRRSSERSSWAGRAWRRSGARLASSATTTRGHGAAAVCSRHRAARSRVRGRRAGRRSRGVRRCRHALAPGTGLGLYRIARGFHSRTSRSTPRGRGPLSN